MSFDPQNILVIDFGQLGDVVLSLPALRAIREKFPTAKISVVVGKPAAEVITLSGYADSVIPVDRVALRDGPKLLAIGRIAKLVREVRRKKFDFVIDLHSLFETNLLGFFSGAPKRLFARRDRRSLDYLANFEPQPPLDKDRQRHLTDTYLDVLIPLGIKDVDRTPRLHTRREDDLAIDKLLKKEKAENGVPLAGLFPGAGHPGRCWPLERFGQLADFLVRNDGVRPVVFLGPEERAFASQIKKMFPASTVIFDRLTIAQLAAAQARLAVFISNDTGPMHIATAVGTPVVYLLNRATPHIYMPIAGQHRAIFSRTISEITVDEVYEASRAALAAERMATLFAS